MDTAASDNGRYHGESVALVAPAKLTLSLRVTGVRDDGLHLIDAEMVTVDLVDDLVVSEGSGLTMTTPEDGLDIPTGPDNLITRALALAGTDAAVDVVKRIPAGAGLGGGSADAAAILRWAGYDDLEAAASIGADIAFCVVGGRARVTGIGEVVEPLPFKAQTLTLLTPPIGCSTPAVYRAWDEMGGPVGPNGNDLEPAALQVAPDLAIWRDELATLSNETPRLAGSGSTWWVPGSHPSDLTRVVQTTPAQPH